MSSRCFQVASWGNIRSSVFGVDLYKDQKSGHLGLCCFDSDHSVFKSVSFESHYFMEMQYWLSVIAYPFKYSYFLLLQQYAEFMHSGFVDFLYIGTIMIEKSILTYSGHDGWI